MATLESKNSTEQREPSGGLFQRFRKILGTAAADAAHPTAPTPDQEFDAPTPCEEIVVAPGGYHVQESQPAVSPEDLGQMMAPVRDGLNLLPPLSQVVTELLREIQSEKSSAASVAEIVSSDPALAAALIRAVNSAAFGLKRRLSSVNDAVSYLGLAIVKSMVIRLRLGDLLKPTNAESAADIEDLWVHSLAVSYAADCLAKRVPGVDRGFVSTLGLLHDVGKLAVTALLPGQAADLRELADNNPTADQRQLETQILGVDHAAMGADLAERWRLPADLAQAIRWHHRPTDAFPPAEALPLDKIVGVLKVANQLAKYCHPYANRMQIDAVDDQTFDMLGLERSLYKLLDDPMRQAISRAIFFVDDKSDISTPRRFLRPLRGETAAAVATAEKPSGHVAVNDGVIDAIFAGEGLRESFRSSPGEVEKCLTAALANLKEMELSTTTFASASALIRSFLPNLLSINTAFDHIDFAQQKRGGQVVMAFRTPGLAAKRRTGVEVSAEGAARLAEADLANALNLGWLSRIAISQTGDAVILLSK